MQGRGRQIAAKALAFGLGGLLLAAVADLAIEVARRPKPATPRVTIGTRDEIYYSHAATRGDAAALGDALRRLGYFRDSGATVLLSRNAGGRVVSFVVQDGLWNRPEAVRSFEEIGRRIARTIGGFPVEIRLVDSSWKVEKTVQVGQVRIGARDEIYYLGSATEADAESLGRALRAAGYLKDLGVSVSVSKGNGTEIGFVVGEGVGRQPESAARFAQLARAVAPSVGGLPLRVELLSPQMELESAVEVR